MNSSSIFLTLILYFDFQNEERHLCPFHFSIFLSASFIGWYNINIL